MPNIRNITVKELEEIIANFRREGQINDDTEVWLSSDEEGNYYSPFVMVGDMINASTDDGKLTLYPIST